MRKGGFGASDRPRLMSLNRRLALTYAVVAVPFIAVSGWFMYARQVTLADRSNALLTAEVERTGQRVAAGVLRVQQTLATLSITVPGAVRGAAPNAGCAAWMQNLPAILPDAAAYRITLADRTGAPLCESRPSAELPPPYRELLAQMAATSQASVGVIGADAAGKPWGEGAMLAIAYPIRSGEVGAPASGAAIATIPAAQLSAVAATWNGPKQATLWLVDAQRRSINLAAGAPGAAAAGSSVAPSPLWQPPADAGAVQRLEQADAAWFAARVDGALALLVRVPAEDLLSASLGRIAVPLAILSGLLLTGLALLLIALARWVLEPLQALDRMIQSSAAPTAPAAVAAAGTDPTLSELPDQIYQLGQSFASRHAEWARDLQLRELLLAEVNHRIKNSFQMVLSLLRLQERSVSDANAAAILRAAQERVSTLFVVHRLLEHHGDTEVVDAGELVWNVAETLIPGGDMNGRIAFHVEADPLLLRADQAVVLGLIVNEWITNSLRHGFGNGRPGRIEVHLRVHDQDVTLHYADDGSGPADRLRPGFGTRLVAGLLEQLEATLTALPGPGCRWELRFRMQLAQNAASARTAPMPEGRPQRETSTE